MLVVAAASLATGPSALAGPLSPDPSFSGDGSYSIETGSANAEPLSSRIDAAGTTTVAFTDGAGDGVARIRDDGETDSGFGSGGIVRLTSLSEDDLVAVRPLGDGNLAVARFARGSSGGRLVVLDDSGDAVGPELQLNAGFGVELLDIDANGRPVVAGNRRPPAQGFPPTVLPGFQVERFGVDGQPDQSWGGGDGIADVSRSACIGQNYSCQMIVMVARIYAIAISDDDSVAVEGILRQDRFNSPTTYRDNVWVVDPAGVATDGGPGGASGGSGVARSDASTADGTLAVAGEDFLSGFDGSDSLRVLGATPAGTSTGERAYGLPQGAGTWSVAALGGESDGSAWATNGSDVAHLLADGSLEDLGGSVEYATIGANFSSISPVGTDRVELVGTTGTGILVQRLFHGEVEPPQPVPPLKVKLLGVSAPKKFKGVAREGITARVRCNRDCRLRMEIRIPRSLAHRLGTGRTIGSERGVASGGEATRITAHLSLKAIDAIRRVRPRHVRYSVRVDGSPDGRSRGASGSVVAERGSFAG